MFRKLPYLSVVLLLFWQPNALSADIRDSFPLSTLKQISNESGVEVTIRNPISGSHSLTKLTTNASLPQLNPIKTPISVRFQSQSVTVGRAAGSIAKTLGYKLLSSGQNISQQTKDLLASDLPLVHMKFEHLPADEILRSLSGPGFVPVVDHVSRYITFDPIPLFAKTGRYAEQTNQNASIVTRDKYQNTSDTQLLLAAKQDGWAELKPQSTLSPDLKTDEGSGYNFSEFETIREEAIGFLPGSVKTSKLHKESISTVLRRFTSQTDIVKIISCANYPRTKFDTERIENIKLLIQGHGVPPENIHIDKCTWSEKILPANSDSLFVGHLRKGVAK